jgi:hypothetical protein
VAPQPTILYVRRTPAACKQLAVPFRAAHNPSERSEYAHPDTALTLTTLAYYSDGLSEEQLEDTLAALLRLGLNAQVECYREWLKLVEKGRIPPGMPGISRLHSAALSGKGGNDYHRGYEHGRHMHTWQHMILGQMT